MSALYYTRRLDSPLGGLLLESDGDALTGLCFEDRRRDAGVLRREASLPVFDRTERWLRAYFRGERPEDAPPLRPEGSPFQQSVWALLRAIPYGETLSYGALARRVAEYLGRERMSAQAVGGAVGRNPIAILIPCHRVIGADGSLTGYAGGLERKRRLLLLEGADSPP